MPQPLTDDGKIKLKELVSHPTKRFKHLNQYLQAEVVETVEQVIETTVEEQTQIQQQETQNYKGKMVDLREFSKAYWPLVVEKVNNSQQAHSKGGALFKLLSEELFANLPQAIKFLSPDAAEQLAKNLPNFVTLNKDNLPQGFFLAKTDEGEWVMDYDPYLERDDTNPYTLKASPVDESEETQRNCQARIAQYSTAQASLLQKFLGETNPSQYDLRNTLDAFDFFWAEFSYLCQKEDLDPEAVQHDWERPEHGNPLVYMERLITILRNARSVREQVQSWSVIHDRHKNTHSFSLSNYGPYYASMYEGFSLVATLMELEIPHLIQKSQPFNPHFKLYRTALDKIANVLTYDEDIYQAQEMRPHQYWLIKPDNWYDSVISLCYRFLGQEEQGISLQSFCDIAQAYKDQKYGKGSWYHGNSALLAALLFLTHKPVGDPRQALFQFFDVMENADNDSKALMTVIRRLTGLYNRDIRLDISQGTVLFRILRGMNSAEFQGYGISKAALLDRLFDQLQQNRLAVLNLFDVLETRGYFKFPLSFALDTAEVLREDPEVASFFQDDLLSFSYLLTDPKAEGTRQDPRIKEIRNLLRKAVVNQEQPNNLLYALQKIMKSATFFSYRDFLGFCNELDSLGDFNPGKVDSMLASSDLKIKPRRSSAFQVKNTDIRSSVIELIKLLAKTRGEDMGLLEGELATKSTEALQELLNIKWEQNLGLMGHGFKTAFDRIVRKIRDAAIAAAFAPHTPGSKDLLALFAEKIANTPDFQNARDLSNVQDMCHKIQSLSDLVKKIRSNPYVQAEESTFITIFSKPEYSSLSYQSLFSLLGLLIEMPSRDYSGLLQALLMPPNQPESRLIECLTQLNHWSFPTAYMESFIPFARQNLTKADFQDYLQLLHDRFVKDPDDPMLEVLMTNSQLDFDDCKAILKISEQMPENQDKLAKLLSNLVKNNQLKGFISVIKAIGDLDKESLIIEIVSLAQASSGKQLRAQETRISPDLIHALKGLSPEQLRQVRTFYSSNLLSQRCLYQGLKNRDKEQNFGEFLASFEKVPFGQRDPAQFDCSAVERVVNNSRDLLNQSLQSYHYRKQLAESFLFVNAIGHSVPIFANKTAKDLSNAEIAQYFSMLKQTKKETPRDAFQARLVVLALLREAMYRSTGEFPYSTQMLSLIEGMMQPGDYISNIDTGQGKSLVDCMRAALLYLDSDRVELTTSSIVDAKRDIGNYGPFLKLLGIPYSEKPVIASSKLIDFKQEGINFTTMTQIDLFFAKAKALGETYEKPSTKVSLVVNESDHAILDDKVIHRFATADNQTPGFGQEWVYEGIYEFTADRNFIRNKNTTAKQDIANLKLFLKAKALHSKKSAKLVDKFSDKQYREWIESGLIVNYIIKENEEYVIPKEFETKKINGKSVQTKVVKVLLSDKKVSPDSTFGNGIQQILYAKLNKQEGKQEFVIEPQSKTIISSTNRNLLQYYRSKKGFIWGSSGTVGSREEVLEDRKSVV